MNAPDTHETLRTNQSRKIATPQLAGQSNRTTNVGSLDANTSSTPGTDVAIEELTIAYSRGGVEIAPVREFNMFAPAGRVTALVGRSGVGKTTLLSAIGAMLRPKEGTIWVGGTQVTELKGKSLDFYRRKRVGIVHQAYNLIPSLTAMENVEVPLRMIGIDKREAKKRAIELLFELGLQHEAFKRPGQLSGGQQQRVAVARAVATGATVILADEPTAHLDGSTVADVQKLFRSLAEGGKTVILSTHDDRLLVGADQIINLNH